MIISWWPHNSFAAKSIDDKEEDTTYAAKMTATKATCRPPRGQNTNIRGQRDVDSEEGLRGIAMHVSYPFT